MVYIKNTELLRFFIEFVFVLFSIRGITGAILGVPGAVQEGEMKGNRGFYTRKMELVTDTR